MVLSARHQSVCRPRNAAPARRRWRGRACAARTAAQRGALVRVTQQRASARVPTARPAPDL